jgi:formylglycine-generating enzyme required for sulfatase activity
MVAAGSVCIDKYEVSVWSSPTGGTQYGATSDNYPASCLDTGFGCKGKIFARSVAGVTPSRFITYFQAQQALANSGKRLPSNAEWQQAVAGTPEGQCNTSDGVPQTTGTFTDCVSDWGAVDMVGNLMEWVGDWVPASTDCPGWGSVGTFSSDDDMCLAGADQTATGPGPLLRGGFFSSGAKAGAFSVQSFTFRPQASALYIGFRGVR